MSRITDSDLPALFIDSDKLSKESQREYIKSMKISISMLALSSILGVKIPDDPILKKYFASIIVLITITSLFYTYKIKSEKKDKDWYDGRAVAESVKTKAWRYMLHSDPYVHNLSNKDARDAFIHTLSEIRNQRRDFIAKISLSNTSASQITDKMSEVRGMDFKSRKGVYLNQRISDQINWYASKSKENKRKTDIWFNIIFILQIASVVSSVLIVFSLDIGLNLVSVFASLAASSIAWLQLKRHQELSNSYNLASQELHLVLERGKLIDNPTEFANFVSDAESAISREHTLWAARRDAY